MRANHQHAIIKNPIPILVGNTSFAPSSVNDYYYTSAYIVDEDKSNGVYNDNIIIYDHYFKDWILYNYNTDTYFPILSGHNSVGSDIGFKMVPYVNVNGYPIFKNEYEDTKAYFDKDLNKWVIGSITKSTSGYLYHMNGTDINETTYGHYGNYNGSTDTAISSFTNYQYDGEPLDYQYIAQQGNLLNQNLLKFENNYNENVQQYNTSAMITLNDYAAKRKADSPQIISGEPCLGYYDYLGNLFIVGSICIGTQDLTTVPPMIGQIDQSYVDYMDVEHNYSNSLDIFGAEISGEIYDQAYWWIGTTFDKNKAKWDLYQIITYIFGADEAYDEYNYILVSGGQNPFNSDQFWYLSGETFESIFTYDKLSGGLEFTAYPSGQNINLEIVGLTNYNADEVKHNSDANLHYLDTYIGNWLSPQPTWEAQNVE